MNWCHRLCDVILPRRFTANPGSEVVVEALALAYEYARKTHAVVHGAAESRGLGKGHCMFEACSI